MENQGEAHTYHYAVPKHTTCHTIYTRKILFHWALNIVLYIKILSTAWIRKQTQRHERTCKVNMGVRKQRFQSKAYCWYLVAKSCLTPLQPHGYSHEATLSMGFSRQEYWSGLPFPSSGDLSNPGIQPGFPTLQADFLQSEPPGKTFKRIFNTSLLVLADSRK